MGGLFISIRLIYPPHQMQTTQNLRKLDGGYLIL
jgi:hypothetical protein